MSVEPITSPSSQQRDPNPGQAPRASTRPGNNASKTPLACATCRKKKVKCSGVIPCQYCQKRGIKCVPRTIGQRNCSDGQILELQARLARYEPQRNIGTFTNESSASNSPMGVPLVQNALGSSSELPNAPLLTQNATPRVFPHTPVGTGLSVAAPSNTSNHLQKSTIASDSSLSSSHTFGSRIHTLLDHARPNQHLATSRIKPFRSAQLSKKDSGRVSQINEARAQIPSFPTKDNAHRLLEAVTFYIGQTQAHFDARELLDRISYISESSLVPDELWTPEILAALLVLAIGKLFVGELDPDGEIPGTELFEFVLASFPTLGALYNLGRLGVEVTALIAVYLQNSNRREEAYIYISTALRLAISHGFHRESRVEKFVQSERVRLNRLWWTVYMQERRLAAATGNPSGINDEAIELPLPTNAPGFGPAAPLCTNIKIGRVVGRIITGLYGKEFESEQTFVADVQDIVQTLYDISQEIPSELDTTVRNSGSDLSLRTTAMLHLMLYQATLLTIRPIMLHVTQLILENNFPSEQELSGTPLGKLTETCIEAARRMLKAIIILKQRNMLLIFGFFDLESAVSAAVVMILTSLCNSACPEEHRLHPTPGLNDALEVLQFLAGKGNIFALQRLQEAQRLWELTKAFLQRAHSETNTQNQAPEYGQGPVSSAGDDCIRQWEANSFGQPNIDEDLTTSNNAQSDSTIINMMTLDASLWDDISNIWTLRPDQQGSPLPPGESTTSLLAEESYRYYYSLYNNMQAPSVGDDMEGLTDLGRYLNNFGSY